MNQLAVKSFKRPDEHVDLSGHGSRDTVMIDGMPVDLSEFKKGWRWSNDVKPIAGTDSCQTHHTGICLSGQMTVRFDDGSEVTIGPGDVVDLDPGHDAWTDGDEPCVLLDTGIKAYAKPS